MAAADYFVLQGNVEGLDFADLLWGTANAKPITVSFQVYVSISGTYSFCVKNGAGTYSYVFTVALTAGSNYVTCVIPGCTTGVWPTGNAKCLSLVFDLGSGTTWRTGTTNSWVAGNFCGATEAACLVSTLGAVYEVSSIQIEAGSVATPFEFLPYQAALAWCQRYYYVSSPLGMHANAGGNSGMSHLTSNLRYGERFPVLMRTNPTLTLFDVAGNAGKVSYYTTAWYDNGSVSVGPYATNFGFYIGHGINGSVETQFTYIADARM